MKKPKAKKKQPTKPRRKPTKAQRRRAWTPAMRHRVAARLVAFGRALEQIGNESATAPLLHSPPYARTFAAKWREAFAGLGIDPPATLEEWERLAARAGVSGETILKGGFTLADVWPAIVGALEGEKTAAPHQAPARPPRPVSAQVITDKFAVSMATLRRYVKERRLTDRRAAGHAPNARLLLDPVEVAALFATRKKEPV